MSDLGDSFKAGSVKNIKLHLPVRLILEGLGIETGASERTDDIWLEKLIVLLEVMNFLQLLLSLNLPVRLLRM